MPERQFYLASTYVVALVAAFVTALGSLVVPGWIESAVGADGLLAVQLASGLGLIGLLLMADLVNGRIRIGAGEEDRERQETGREGDRIADDGDRSVGGPAAGESDDGLETERDLER